MGVLEKQLCKKKKKKKEVDSYNKIARRDFLQELM